MGDGAGLKVDFEHVCALQGFPEVMYGEKLVEKETSSGSWDKIRVFVKFNIEE